MPEAQALSPAADQGTAYSAAAMRALDDHLLRGWPSARVVDLKGWRCAIDRGATRRANSIWPLAWEPGASLGAAITAAERLYREAGLRPCFRITAGAEPPGLAQALAAAGYVAEGASHVLVAPAAPAAPAPSRFSGVALELLTAPSESWLACYAEDRKAELTALRGIFARIAPQHVFAAAMAGDKVASTALAVATGAWVQISAVRTLPAFRRRGLCAAILSTIREWACAQDATQLALMVEAGNAPALGLYRKAGFVQAYDYHYLAKSEGAARA